MFDTVKIKYDLRDAKQTLKYIEQSDNINGNRHTGEYIEYGRVENMFVKAKDNFISITGSLAKFYYGNNFNELSIQDTKRAVEKLSDMLHIGMQDFDLIGIDLGWNLLMNENIYEYLSFLNSVKRHTKQTFEGKNNNGLQFKTKSGKKIHLYDKIGETIVKKGDIPEFAKGKNILRIEVSYQNRLNQVFKQDVLVKDLYNIPFFIKAVDNLENYYFKIEKQPTITIMNPKVKNIYSLTYENNFYRYQGIIRDFGSLEKYFEFLDREQKKGNISPQTKSNRKKDIKKWAKYESFVIDTVEPIKELDSKVIQRAKHYRKLLDSFKKVG